MKKYVLKISYLQVVIWEAHRTHRLHNSSMCFLLCPMWQVDNYFSNLITATLSAVVSLRK